MSWEVRPDLPDESERDAVLRAVEAALRREEAERPAAPTAWWRSGFDDLGGDSPSQESWPEADVAET